MTTNTRKLKKDVQSTNLKERSSSRGKTNGLNIIKSCEISKFNIIATNLICEQTHINYILKTFFDLTEELTTPLFFVKKIIKKL